MSRTRRRMRESGSPVRARIFKSWVLTFVVGGGLTVFDISRDFAGESRDMELFLVFVEIS